MGNVAPVLLLLFNRPDLAARVFERVRDARPSRLFLAVDGPRKDRGDEAAVAANRDFASQVDWPCEVHTLFRDTNLGCGRSVSGAISWFFENVEAGIILEDDCLPDPTFFQFATELLDRYGRDEEIMMINGSSIMKPGQGDHQSYYFSMFDRIWGWASWRRAWQHYQFELSQSDTNDILEKKLNSLSFLSRLFLRQRYSLVRRGKINTWDYQWEHAIWSNGGLTITPFGNLISNIGFDGRGTHTVQDTQSQGFRELSRMEFPLKHPESLSRDTKLDRIYESSEVMSCSILMNGILRRLRRLVNR